jgi:DNA-binding CsgD family transcriptional regulator
MGHQEDRISDSPFPNWTETSAPTDEELENVQLSAARARAIDEARAEIARKLNAPLTALLLYMGEIKQHSQQLSHAAGNRGYLQQVVENALQQTERVCAMVKEISDTQDESVSDGLRKSGWDKRAVRGKEPVGSSSVMLTSNPGLRPLTKREREVLNLISAGYSNKQGALRMSISPRTFESHRAVAMRKLGARNTADLVRLTLLHPTV